MPDVYGAVGVQPDMPILVVALLAATAAPALPSAATPARLPRVFVAPLVGASSDPATLHLVEDRVLVAARALADRYEIIGAGDVRNILDVEASKQAMGCDTTSCANEIADALNADELLTGQLGRIGETWQLTITRTERASLRIVGRAVRETKGETPEGLLNEIHGQVGEVFGVVDTGPGALTVIGGGAVTAGALALVVGGGLYGYSWIEYGNAVKALQQPQDLAAARRHKTDGLAALPLAWILGGSGLAVALLGGGLLAVDAMEEP